MLLSSTCSKSDNCAQYFYLPVQIQPEQPVYKVGDTITVWSKFSKFVTGYRYDNGVDNRVNEFNMEGINWKPHTWIYKIDTLRGDVAPYTSVYSNFDVIINQVKYPYERYDYSKGETGLVGEYRYVLDSFDLQFKIVARNPGIYYFSQFNTVQSGSLSKQTYPGDCFNGNRNSFDVFSTVNENRDNNFDFLLESPDSLYFDFYHRSRSNFREKGGYCFKVIK